MLDATPLDSALSEIYLLRLLLTRVLAAAGGKARLTLKHRLSMLTAFCQSAITMASLVRFEYKQQGPGPSLLDLLYPASDSDDL